MKSPFKDRLKDAGKELPLDKLFNFDAPSKDAAQSGYISAGQNHGVGYNVPMGREGSAKQGETIPTKSFNMNAKDIGC